MTKLLRLGTKIYTLADLISLGAEEDRFETGYGTFSSEFALHDEEGEVAAYIEVEFDTPEGTDGAPSVKITLD